MHVLVVDDDASTRYLVKTILEARRHRVTLAEDGIEALELASSDAPDVVVSDILMPRMDGYQLCMRWKSDPQLAAVPLIFYTATYTEDADEGFAHELGADAFVRKPQDAPELVRIIEDTVRDARSSKRRTQPGASTDDDVEVMREYNERLVRKLEQKAAELATVNAELQTALEMLSDEMSVKDTLIERLNEELNKLQDS